MPFLKRLPAAKPILRSACLPLVTVTVLLAVTHRLRGGEVRTIAGTGQAGQPQSSAEALKSPVSAPFGVVKGPDGAVYICEVGSHVIRRLDESTGELQIVAGTGKAGYSGDGGLAVDARLNEPYEIRFDSAGNMLFVEMQNHIVRRVNRKTGVIETVAGCGKKGFAGDNGPATQARLHRPHSIVVDENDHIFICDIGNHRIRRVDSVTGVITTFAGTGKQAKTPDGAPVNDTPLNGPRALDIESNGNLVLALREGNAVYRINLKSKTYEHLAGTGKKGFRGDGGPARRAELSGPKGIAVGPQGDIYLADTESHTIRVVRKASGHIETLVGNGRQGDGPDGRRKSCRLARPHGVFVDSQGNVYIGDSSNHRVRKYTPQSAKSRDATRLNMKQ